MGLLKRLSANRKIQIVGVFFIIALFLLFMRDLSHPFTFSPNLGIEFAGGVRIPISLEQSVDSSTMSDIIDVIKTRINKYGLSQANVRPLGDKEIIVEIPKADPSVINHVESVLREQGKFEAILDGKLALSGEDIIPNAVGGPSGESVNPNPDGTYSYQLVFAITGNGQERFAEVASRKQGLPIYMFLDRPTNAAIIIPREYVNASALTSAALEDALRKEGDDLLLVYVNEFEQEKSLLENKSTVIIGVNLNSTQTQIYSQLREMGFITAEEQLANSSNATITKQLVIKSLSEITPVIAASQGGKTGLKSVVSSWKAIGLTSSPTLQVEPVKQNEITSYSISGSSSGVTPVEAKLNAVNELKDIKTVISGGRLPVNAVIGSSYDVAPSLGRQFLFYSFIGILTAILLVSIIITIRYRKLELILPIVITNIVEITLLLAFLGTFGTLDLSAMAGVIALIGTGVDNQIIITDEMLKKRNDESELQVHEERSARSKLGRAFAVVFTTAAVSIVSMLPLLLSGIVEVMGFALATIMGVVIGVLVTRPAYGALVEEMFGRKMD